jgi:hypothetical protein
MAEPQDGRDQHASFICFTNCAFTDCERQELQRIIDGLGFGRKYFNERTEEEQEFILAAADGLLSRGRSLEIHRVEHFVPRQLLQNQAAPRTSSGSSFLSLWEFFPYLLPHRVRERVFEPAHQEMLEDYLLTKRIRGRWARRWLSFCFTFRTALMVFDCLRAMAADRGIRLLLRLVPNPVKRWWIS